MNMTKCINCGHEIKWLKKNPKIPNAKLPRWEHENAYHGFNSKGLVKQQGEMNCSCTNTQPKEV